MNEVYVKFEGTKREGSVAAGSYLLDAAHMLGVDLECDCKSETEKPTNSCAVKIIKGTAFLSKPTAEEIEQLGEAERKEKQRLACQTKLEKPGEVEVMVVKKKAETEEEVADDPEARTEAFKKDFAELPLDKKIASLVEIEAMALSDAFSYVLNSPYEAVGKVMEVMAGFGKEKEDKEREAKVPEEHRETKSDEKKEPAKADKPKAKPAKKPAATKRRRKPSNKTAAKDATEVVEEEEKDSDKKE